MRRKKPSQFAWRQPERACQPPLCKGRWVGCQPSRRDCLSPLKIKKTILQLAALPASFAGGSLWCKDFLHYCSLCCLGLVVCVCPLSLLTQTALPKGEPSLIRCKNLYGSCLSRWERWIGASQAGEGAEHKKRHPFLSVRMPFCCSLC